MNYKCRKEVLIVSVMLSHKAYIGIFLSYYDCNWGFYIKLTLKTMQNPQYQLQKAMWVNDIICSIP